MDEKKVIEAYDLVNRVFSPDSTVRELHRILKEALAPEPRFYVGQPVLVSHDGKEWSKDRLDTIDTATVHKYQCEKSGYRHCKPDPDAVSLINWHSVDEFMTMPEEAVLSSDKKSWAIIPDPEWL